MRKWGYCKLHKIVKKACHKLPEKRYHSAAEMRNAIEKLCPLYNWKIVEDDYWRGETIGYPIKDVYEELKRNYIGLIVTNNGRKLSQDSKKILIYLKLGSIWWNILKTQHFNNADYKFVLYDVNTMLIGETRRSGGLSGSILALKILMGTKTRPIFKEYG